MTFTSRFQVVILIAADLVLDEVPVVVVLARAGAERFVLVHLVDRLVLHLGGFAPGRDGQRGPVAGPVQDVTAGLALSLGGEILDIVARQVTLVFDRPVQRVVTDLVAGPLGRIVQALLEAEVVLPVIAVLEAGDQ